MLISRSLLSGVMAALFCLASPALGGEKYYVKIEGTKQGEFKGNVQRMSSRWIEIASFSQAAESPRDAATGQASGRRKHEPIVITKQAGASSPQIWQALHTNELLKDVLFQFVRTTAEGKEQVYHTIKLTNATIASVERIGGNSKNEEERIKLTYQNIEVMGGQGGVTSKDNWTAPK